MNKLLIALLGAAIVTLGGCSTASSTMDAVKKAANMSAGVPWEADESTLPAIPPLVGDSSGGLPWAADESVLPAIEPDAEFTDYEMLT